MNTNTDIRKDLYSIIVLWDVTTRCNTGRQHQFIFDTPYLDHVSHSSPSVQRVPGIPVVQYGFAVQYGPADQSDKDIGEDAEA